MKLKRLELNGFKSFPEKTIVSFPKGISGVVGPNGCGKSNIVDAIKWVMGEQSPKQLRGKGMDDVIFAGSNGKSSVGMAEVSLVLDNDNGSIPQEYADFSEVVVTRRLFRDGESEYAINNKACRLKDITHLFMDTGVGSKAYSVIEQGRVGAIIDSKPEDRRHWIEEAAGVSKYKSKKNESLRKLELTQQNLLRVGDVIAEIKRQMNSLYRQAKKAERFKEIRKQAKEVELILLAKEYQILVLEKGVKEEGLVRQQEQAGEYRDDCQTYEASLDQLQSELLGLERNLKEKQEQYYQQKANLQNQEAMIQQYQKELENLTKEALEIEKEIGEIEKWLNENQTREKVLSEEVNSFTQTLALEEDQVREKEQSLAEAKKELTRTQEEGEQIKDFLVTKLTELTRVRNMRVGLMKLQEDRQRRIIRQNEEKAQLTTRLDFLKASVQETEARLGVQREALKEFKERIFKAQELKNEIEQIHKTLEGELLDLDQAWKQDQAQIKNLKDIRDNFQSYQNGVRALLQADWNNEEQERSETFRQILVEGLETEPGCEMAVETALGEALQAFMIQDPTAAVQGIAFLKDRDQGRASFLTLPPPLASEEFSSRPWEEKGLVPLLSKVSAGEKFQAWLNRLLGPFVLVRDLREGWEVWKNQAGQVCVITREGDLIDSRGIISGGSSRNPESGILFQKNLIHKLELKVGEWQEKINRKKESLQVGVADLERQINTIKNLEKEKQEKEEDILELEKRLIGFQEETKPLQRRLQLLFQEEDEYRTQEEDQAEEEKALASQEEDLNKEIEGLRTAIQRQDEQIGNLESGLEQERQSLTLAYTQLSALKEKGGHIGREWERLKESVEEKQTRKKRLLEKILSGQKIQKELVEKTSLGETLVKNLMDQVNDLEVQIQLVNQTWEKGIKQKEDLETAFKELRSLLNESERQENELKMELAQIVMKTDHLKEQTLEQWGLLPEEALGTLKGDEDLESLKIKRKEFKEKLEQLGEVNLTALEEYNAFKERYDFYHSQEEDLLKSIDSLKRAIQKINFTSKELFLSAFKIIQEKMNEVFPLLFGGGSAKLSLTDEEDPLESGLEIMVHPPGKRLTNMTLLSGGEKALTALALLFSTYLVKPSPFCLLDEIDAFLDEANVERFKSLVRNIVRDSQIILITHNRRIMEMADTLYGVTMEQPGVSKLVSVRLDTLQ